VSQDFALPLEIAPARPVRAEYRENGQSIVIQHVFEHSLAALSVLDIAPPETQKLRPSHEGKTRQSE
jgi:hypothetical protein